MQIVLIMLAILALALSAAAANEKKMPYTSFQTPSGYRPENDIRTDAVIVYSNDADRIRSWKEKGYVVQTMYGFRTGPDYINDHPEEAQTTADGTKHTCGPNSYYMVPTPRRIQAAVDYFTEAIKNGTSAVCPEEPEFFVVAGYSESFKRAWQEHYGEPWQDQATSVEARYASERLKAKMECDMVKAIMDAAARQDPTVRRMVACHSAVSYYAWGIIYPHYECLMIPNLQEIIGQVWTGTARTACTYAGKRAERTFEHGFLEYSSLANLVRGTGKRLWFLMDPLEDNPNRTMEDYRTNYVKTLVASLMFPEVDAYEVMPWPGRIYGHVPDDYATVIGSVINALGDMHLSPLLSRRGAGGEVSFDTGTRGIATFVADSMAWQRGEPHASDFDCFYGITLPLIYKGVPIQVAQLERTPDKGYLDPYKVLLLSYDILKPMKPDYNQAIADWVKQGGVLVCFSGSDPYNALPEWWGKAGYASPMDDLYARLGLSEPLQPTDPPQPKTIQVGKGWLVHVGVAPSYFAQSMEAAERLRAIAKQACDKAGAAYREQAHMGIRRGKYVAYRTFDGEKRLKGAYIDLLDHKLPVLRDPVIKADQLAFYCDVTDGLASNPKLLYSSSKLESSESSASGLRLKLSGPLKTKGVARVYTGGRSIKLTQPAGAKVEVSADTAAVTFDNEPAGTNVELNWE